MDDNFTQQPNDANHLHLKALQLNESNKENLPGYWIFNNKLRKFLLDRNCAQQLGIDYTGKWIRYDEISAIYAPSSNQKFLKIMEGSDHSDIIIEELKLIAGRRAGADLMVNGGVLTRQPDGSVHWCCGMLSQRLGLHENAFVQESSTDGVWDWDGASGNVRFSQSYLNMLGYARREDFPSTLQGWADEIVHPDDVAGTVAEQLQILNNSDKGDYFECSIRLKHRDGHYIWTLGRGTVLQRDQNGKAIRIVGTNSDISVVAENLWMAQEKIFRDGLTGAYNRSYLEEYHAEWLKEEDLPLSIIYADLTGLKLTNDNLGHQAGDYLIMEAVKVLQHAIAHEHQVIRLGGDEFLVTLPRCSDVLCLLLCGSLQTFISEHNKKISNQPPLFLELGRATFGTVENDSFDRMFRRADAQMQSYKQQHRSEHVEVLKNYIERKTGRTVDLYDQRLH